MPQTLEVLLQAVDALAIDTDSFEYSIPIEQAVIENRDLRILFFYEFAIQENLHRGNNCLFVGPLQRKICWKRTHVKRIP